MHSLIEGNDRFQREIHPGMAEHFSALATGQSPHTLFVTCSDSRVDPSLITQTLPGEIFVIRNAGNLVPKHGADDGSASAVEYAVAALGVRRVVVCGHLGCGAMGGLLHPASLESLPTVARWVEHAAATRVAVSDNGAENVLEQAVRHNVLEQLDNLLSHPSVARAIAAGALELEGWVYEIPTGRIEVISAEKGSS